MSTLAKGFLLAAVQALLVAGLGAKFLHDRSHYPRLWVEAAPYDPDMPIRGRYVSIALRVDVDREAMVRRGEDRAPNVFRARLETRGDRLVAVQDDVNGRHWVNNQRCAERACWQLSEPLAYFIPEHATDPSRRQNGETLWAEMTLPPTGAPRPIRLGVKKGDAIEPIAP